MKFKLTCEQKLAARTTAARVAVIAGPGTGKTSVIEQRVFHLLKKGVQAKRIVVLAFSKSVAAELGIRFALAKSAPVHASTIHSFALHLLSEGHRKFDPAGAKALLKRTLEEAPDFGIEYTELESILTYSANALVDVRQAIDRQFERWNPYAPNILSIADTYAAQKRSLGILDYNDLIVQATQVLAETDAAKYRLRYAHIVVDEFQDLSPAQRRLVEAIVAASRNCHIFVVGDPAQSIYQFRGVSGDWLAGTPKSWADAKVYRLTKNHRSTEELVKLSSAVEESFGLRRHLTSFKSTHGIRPKLKEFLTQKQEAMAIARKIQKLIELGKPPDQIAVLARHAYDLRGIRQAAQELGLPYEWTPPDGLLDHDHVVDVMAIVRIGSGVNCVASLTRALRLYPGVSSGQAREISRAVLECCSRKAMRRMLRQLSPKECRKFFLLRKCLREASLRDTPLSEKISRIAFLISPLMTKKYRRGWSAMAADFQDLSNFATGCTFKQLQMRLEVRELSSAPNAGKKRAVMFSTIHAAKGLEWDTVFVVGLNDGALPSRRAMGPEQQEEEQRIFFVAITRAKNRLYLTRSIRSFGQSTKLSRFLREKAVSNALDYLRYQPIRRVAPCRNRRKAISI